MNNGEEQPAVPATETAAPIDSVKVEQETSELEAEPLDGEEGGEDGDRGAGQSQRQSTRRKPHVDLGRLDVRRARRGRSAPRARARARRCAETAGCGPPLTQVNTVRKYRRLFKIGDPQQPGSKEELLPAVVRHFQNLVRLPWLPCDADNSP